MTHRSMLTAVVSVAIAWSASPVVTPPVHGAEAPRETPDDCVDSRGAAYSPGWTSPLRLAVAKPAFAVPMFQAPQAASGVSGLMLPRTSPAGLATEPPPICHILTIKPDPGIDSKMAVEAPKGLDPKIVQRARCAERTRN